MANAVAKLHKVVSSLPGTLEVNSVYFVRVGTGFDVYLTNAGGTIAYGLNLPAGSATGAYGVAVIGAILGRADVAAATNELLTALAS